MMEKPKILHIGLCVTPDPTHGLKRAFIEVSSEYKEINSGHAALNKEIVDMTKGFKPDIVFMQIQEGGKIHENVIKHFVDIGAFVINWNGDVRDTTPRWMIDLGNEVSLTSFSNMRDVREMRARGMRSEWLEIWCDKDIFCPVGPVNGSVKDVVFFGNNTHAFPMSGFRERMCDFMRSSFSGFGEYGYGSKAVGNFNASQHDEAAAYRKAKIAINVSHYEIERYTSDRLYRILSTGTAVCLAKRFPGIEDLFEDGVHLRMWDTLDELKSWTEHYLNPENEEERITIARQGMNHCHTHFSCQAFVKNVIALKNETTI